MSRDSNAKPDTFIVVLRYVRGSEEISKVVSLDISLEPNNAIARLAFTDGHSECYQGFKGVKVRNP